jgi:hypothetical protein
MLSLGLGTTLWVRREIRRPVMRVDIRAVAAVSMHSINDV